MFPKRPDGSPNGEKFVNLINKQLAVFGKKHNMVLKSHSFRINYVSSMLPHSSVQDAQQIIGHKDVRSTMAYARYELKESNKLKILSKSLVPSEDLNS